MDILLDLVIILDHPEDYIKSLYELCDDDCKEFCCIRNSVVEEINLERK